MQPTGSSAFAGPCAHWHHLQETGPTRSHCYPPLPLAAACMRLVLSSADPGTDGVIPPTSTEPTDAPRASGKTPTTMSLSTPSSDPASEAYTAGATRPSCPGSRACPGAGLPAGRCWFHFRRCQSLSKKGYLTASSWGQPRWVPASRVPASSSF